MSIQRGLRIVSVMAVLFAPLVAGCDSNMAGGPAPAATKDSGTAGEGKSALGEPNSQPKTGTTPASP